MVEKEVSEELLAFIRNKFLNGDPEKQLDPSTPLLEWGVLNSLNTVLLLTFIRDQFSVRVPPTAISAKGFRNVHNITELVTGLAAAST